MVIKFFTDDKGNALTKKPKGQRVSTKPVERSFIPIKYYEDDLTLSMDGGKGYTMVFDIECYVNYFLIGFKCIETQKYVIFEDSPDETINLDKLNWLIWNFRLVGFFSNTYDIPMLFLALRGYKAERMKYCSDILIPPEGEFKHRVDLKETFNLNIPYGFNHIDISEVCPLSGSLKKYSARLHAKRIQDLPFAPTSVLTYDEAQYTKNYCLGSDIVNTEMLFGELAEQFKLRYDLTEKYGIDLRSKSDAQIAEAVIKSEVTNRTGRKIKRQTIGAGTEFQYKPPEFLKFDSVGMQDGFQKIKNMFFEITEDGKLSMPDTLKKMEMQIGKTFYKLGKGGLHSKEKCASYKAENGMMLVDIDVESFYPKLILNSGLFPEAIGPIFLEVFNEIVERRLFAKKNKNKIEADSLKITINGTFGKLGSRWSIMYAPNLLIQVTITGQLALLMLIERMEAAGLQVVSANTDGIVLYIHESQYAKLNEIKDQWCKEANLKMEETRYKALYSKDVNNYIAIKDDKKVKFKGAYSNPWNDPESKIFRFHKNPMTTICIEAVEQILVNAKSIETTIRECTDITKFVCVKDVKGGAHKDGIYLGKTVRWYYAEEERGSINYVINGNQVGNSEGGKPLMDLPDALPDDLDYNSYVEKANSMLYEIGFYQRPKTMDLFND